MKTVFIIVAALFFLASAACSVKKGEAKTGTAHTDAPVQPEKISAREKSPVLIELFTSEGCSSCPPADKNLIYLDEKQPFAQAEIITLALHVDYWNRLGWADPFSSAKYSERQGFYSNTFKLGEVYTPQMIVDGEFQFVGGNLDEAKKYIDEAIKSPKGKVELAISENKLRVKISDLPEHAVSNVFAAIAEDKLSTNVGRGENVGKTLNHTSVVRELKTIGTIAAENNSFETETTFQTQSLWKKQNLKFVVFVQIEKDSRIIGVNQIKF